MRLKRVNQWMLPNLRLQFTISLFRQRLLFQQLLPPSLSLFPSFLSFFLKHHHHLKHLEPSSSFSYTLAWKIYPSGPQLHRNAGCWINGYPIYPDIPWYLTLKPLSRRLVIYLNSLFVFTVAICLYIYICPLRQRFLHLITQSEEPFHQSTWSFSIYHIRVNNSTCYYHDWNISQSLQPRLISYWTVSILLWED